MAGDEKGRRMATGRMQVAARRFDAVRLAEFVALYVGLPLVMALALPPDWLRPVFVAVTGLALILLALTPGFSWRELSLGWWRIDWRHVAAVAAAAALAVTLMVWWLAPHQAFSLPRRSPVLWLTILALYPLLSALPQELIFRPLFFRRYGALFGDRWPAVLVNALAFGLAHLMFWNWVAPMLTVAGGLIFAGAYLGRGFAQAVVLHAVCGAIVFTSGLGTFFYHGAVPLR
jgi:membrane protease YdiL (CAAX protease family)